jgi:hypothetical protein
MKLHKQSSNNTTLYLNLFIPASNSKTGTHTHSQEAGFYSRNAPNPRNSPYLGTPLADNDGTGLSLLVTVNLDTKHLRLGVPAVLRTTGTLLVRGLDGEQADDIVA